MLDSCIRGPKLLQIAAEFELDRDAGDGELFPFFVIKLTLAAGTKRLRDVDFNA